MSASQALELMNVTLFGRRVFADVIKNPEMIQVGPKSNDKCSYKRREGQKAHREDSEDRGQKDASAKQGLDECPPAQKPVRGVGGTLPQRGQEGPTPHARRFQTSGLRNGDKSNSCFSVSHHVYSNLLQQP